MMKTIKFMYFWSNYSDKNNRIEKIPVAVKIIDRLFCMASKLLEFDELKLFLFSNGTHINNNENLESLTDCKLI